MLEKIRELFKPFGSNRTRQAKYLKVEFFDEGVEALEQTGLMTSKRVDEVICDAHNIYLQVLYHQQKGRKIAVLDSDGKEIDALADLVTDKAIAKTYFEKLEWDD